MKRYIKIIIKSEADLPIEELEYITSRNSYISPILFSNQKKMVEYWLKCD